MSVTAQDTLANKTWATLSRSSLAKTPENYRLWYAHLAGEKPSLSRAINELENQNGRITNADCEDLYEIHFTAEKIRQGFLNHVGSLVSKVQLLEQRVTRSVKNPMEPAEAERWDKEAANTLPQALQALQLERVELETWLDEAIAMIQGLRRESGNNLSPIHMDALTGLADHSSFNAELQIRVEIAAERSEPLSLALIRLNHTNAAPEDKSTFQELATVLNGSVKGRDYLARFGEWDFAMVLPRTRLSQADRLCQHIMSELQVVRTQPRTGWLWSDAHVGIGLAQLHLSETPARLLERGQYCLEKAMQNETDKIVCEDSRAAEDQSTQDGTDERRVSVIPLSRSL